MCCYAYITNQVIKNALITLIIQTMLISHVNHCLQTVKPYELLKTGVYELENKVHNKVNNTIKTFSPKIPEIPFQCIVTSGGTSISVLSHWIKKKIQNSNLAKTTEEALKLGSLSIHISKCQPGSFQDRWKRMGFSTLINESLLFPSF